MTRSHGSGQFSGLFLDYRHFGLQLYIIIFHSFRRFVCASFIRFCHWYISNGVLRDPFFVILFSISPNHVVGRFAIPRAGSLLSRRSMGVLFRPDRVTIKCIFHGLWFARNVFHWSTFVSVMAPSFSACNVYGSLNVRRNLFDITRVYRFPVLKELILL